MEVTITKDNFESYKNGELPLVVDLWATWCGPCQMVAPIIEEMAGEMTDVKICKVDVDAEPELARDYRVMSIPMFYVFKNGQPVNRTVGAQSKEALLELLK